VDVKLHINIGERILDRLLGGSQSYPGCDKVKSFS